MNSVTHEPCHTPMAQRGGQMKVSGFDPFGSHSLVGPWSPGKKGPKVSLSASLFSPISCCCCCWRQGILKDISNGYIQVNLKYAVPTCHANVYPGLSDGHWQKAHFSPRKKKNVTELISGSIGDISTARLQSIKYQFTC